MTTDAAAPGGRPSGDDFEQLVESIRARMDSLRSSGDSAPNGDRLLDEFESAFGALQAAHADLQAQRTELESRGAEGRRIRGPHEDVLSTLPVAVITTDEAGSILSANGVASELLATPAAELVGSSLPAMVDPANRGDFDRDLEQLVESGAGVTLVLDLAAGPDAPPRSVVLGGSLTNLERDLLLIWMIQPDGDSGAHDPRHHAARALVRLAGLPGLCSGLDELISRAAEITQVGLGEGVNVSLMLGNPRAPDVVASTSQLGQAVDGAQIVADEGPCLEAHDKAQTVYSDDLLRDPRWPRLQARVEELAVGGVVAVPIELDGELVGSFNLFLQPGLAPDEGLIEASELLMAGIAAALGELGARAELESAAQGMRTALTSRAVIDQAKGIIMADKHCSAEEAFAHLADLSSRSHVKIRDVAAAIVDTASGKRPG